MECYFLRAACYHAIGYHYKAIEDYTVCFDYEAKLKKEDPQERHQLPLLAFYQNQLALYVRHNIDVSIDSFCLDIDLDPKFKVFVIFYF